ncbi:MULTISPECIES: nucleotidyltransferase domain-containing protein [Sulfurimonas]
MAKINEIEFAYLFGSYAKNNQTESSDIRQYSEYIRKGL